MWVVRGFEWLDDEDKEDEEEDILTDVVACPGIDFPPLKHSCYVSRESVFGPAPDEMGRIIVEPRRRTYDEMGRIIIEPRSCDYDKTKKWLSDSEQNKNESPALKDSCYISREAVFGPAPDENNNSLHTEQGGPVLAKRKTPPRNTRR